jgi:homoserine acetyltransferase
MARTSTPMIVEKTVFELPSYTTLGGAVIRQVRVGWESYGTLNQAKDNAVLVTHFFSANSHAAGRYQPDDPLPGYWDVYRSTVLRHRSALTRLWAVGRSGRRGPERASCSRAAR